MAKRILSMRSCSQRKVGGDGECSYNPNDRISELPDEILILILSRLTLREAAATSALSHRWRYLWTSTSRLDFDGTAAMAKTKFKPKLRRKQRFKFRRWVDHVIKLHDAPTLEEFRVNLDLDGRSFRAIDAWLRFALSKSVQRLGLELATDYDRAVYCFPAALCLQLQPTLGGFKSLKSLYLKRQKICWEALDSFLSNCPVLESLTLHFVQSLTFRKCGFLKVVGQSYRLKYLDIISCYGLSSIEIYDNNVVSVRFYGQSRLLLRNLPCLVELLIDPGVGIMNDAFHRFPWCVSQLEHLSLVLNHYFKDYDSLHLIGEFIRLNQLELILLENDVESLLVFTSLIKAAPCLQKLVVQIRRTSGRQQLRVSWEAEKFTHQCLKVVEFNGYFGRPSDDEFILYLTEKAVAIEKIVINPILLCGDIGCEISIEDQEFARNCAREQLQGKVPSQVDLVIL